MAVTGIPDAGKRVRQEEGEGGGPCALPARPEDDNSRDALPRIGSKSTARARLGAALDVPFAGRCRGGQASSFHYEYAKLNRFLAGQTDVLIELYFRAVHPSYPIIDRAAFLGHCRDEQVLDPLLLAAVCLLGSEYWQEPAPARNLARPDIAGLVRFVNGLQLDSNRRRSLETLQAGLLLLQLPERQTWEDVVRVVEEGYELGVYSESAAADATSVKSVLSRRVAWACYIQDKWGALMYGQNCLLEPARWDVRPLTPKDLEDATADKQDSTDGGAVNQVFFEMIKLADIIVDIPITSKGQSRSSIDETDRKQSTRLLLMDVKPVQMKLKQWYASLPGRRFKDQDYSAMSSESSKSIFASPRFTISTEQQPKQPFT